MAKIDVAATIQETSELLEQKDQVLAEIAENRNLLRGSVRNKSASPEQAAWINETFPIQTRRTPEDRVAEAQARLKDLEAKANGGKARTRSPA